MAKPGQNAKLLRMYEKKHSDAKQALKECKEEAVLASFDNRFHKYAPL